MKQKEDRYSSDFQVYLCQDSIQRTVPISTLRLVGTRKRTLQTQSPCAIGTGEYCLRVAFDERGFYESSFHSVLRTE